MQVKKGNFVLAMRFWGCERCYNNGDSSANRQTGSSEHLLFLTALLDAISLDASVMRRQQLSTRRYRTHAQTLSTDREKKSLVIVGKHH